MDSRWFAEDRAEAKKDKSVALEDLIESSTKALKNSTLFQRRLEKIIDDLIAVSEREDEDFSKTSWQQEAIANISRRRTLRELKKIIQL